MSIQQNINTLATAALAGGKLREATEEANINRKYEKIANKAYGEVLNEPKFKTKDISFEKKKMALERLKERQEFMRQEALATIENYNKAQKLGESFHIPSKIISPEGYKRKQENIEALKTVYGDDICYSVELPYKEISFID